MKINVAGAQGGAPKLGKLKNNISSSSSSSSDDSALDDLLEAPLKHGDETNPNRPKPHSKILKKLKAKKDEQKLNREQNSLKGDDASAMEQRVTKPMLTDPKLKLYR